jgi:multisubunit Na+/H+ antiporter MnhF subunit
MSKNAKIAYVSLLSLLGLVFLLVGIFYTSVYDFTIGLILAIVCWAGSGILAKYWGVKKKKD